MSEETAEIIAPDDQVIGETQDVSQEVDSSTTEAETAETQLDSEKETEEKKNGVQKRIDQLTREKYEERRQREAVEKRLKELEEQSKPEPIKPPKEEDFDDYNQYLEQQADYLAARAAEKLSTQQKAKDQQLAQAEEQLQVQKRAEKFGERIQREMNAYEGFMEKMNDPIFAEITHNMDRDLIGLIQESDKATALTYHLATHIEEADRLSRLNPVYAARELARIEAKLELPKPNKISNAPDPIKPIGSNESAVKNPDDMSMDQWMEWRAKTANRG